MKNLKKVIFALMVVFLVVGFIGCKTESDSPKAPVVTNNFKGKTFLGMTGEGEDAYFASYIIFTSDKDCEVMFFDEEPMSATYTVADDVATLKGTGEYAALQLSTTKLTDGKFSITIPPAVSRQEEDIVVSYAVGTLWTILYDIPDSDEDFSWKMPEEELEAAVENSGFVEADYTKDDATKTITLTASGYEKVQALMGGGSEEEGGEVYYYYMHDGELIGGKSTLEDFPYEVEHYGLVEGTDYTIDHENKYINFTDSGVEKLGMSGGSDDETWTVMYNGITVDTFESLEAAGAFASNIGLVENVDYTVNNETQTITLTDAGWIKVQAMGGGSGEEGGGVTSETWTVMYNGITVDTFESLEAAGAFASNIGLVENVDYTVNNETQTITLTDAGWIKVQAMGGGSEEEGNGGVTSEKWTGVDPEGIPFTTFESFEEVKEHVEVNGLELGVDYTLDEEKHIIYLLAKEG